MKIPEIDIQYQPFEVKVKSGVHFKQYFANVSYFDSPLAR